MAIKYHVTVNKEGTETDSTKYDLVTTRKSEYTKFAKEELKKGAESVDVHASYKDQFGQDGYSYVHTFYPEDFNIK